MNYSIDFLLGGVAAMGAGFFTNPLEVVKTRMQLQGELQARGQHAIHYKNVVHAMYAVAKADGVLALQKGLVPALWVQLFLNGFRLGIYQGCESRGLTLDKDGKTNMYKSMIYGAFGATVGAVASSPLFLVKTHLQSQAAASIAVGHQHNHTGSWVALKLIYQQHGIKGLWRGVSATVPRTALGGSAQLTSFAMSKEWLENRNMFSNAPLLRTFVASMIGGVAVSVVMTPFDLILTRLYNQGVDANGKGLLYKSYFDCTWKIWRSEGFLGFYKGLGPNYIRLGPHTVLCLMFWDELKKLYAKLFEAEKKHADE